MYRTPKWVLFLGPVSVGVSRSANAFACSTLLDSRGRGGEMKWDGARRRGRREGRTRRAIVRSSVHSPSSRRHDVSPSFSPASESSIVRLYDRQEAKKIFQGPCDTAI